VETIVDYVVNLLSKKNDLKGRRILVTAGPTVEDIDPVRFISNRSTGKIPAILKIKAARGAHIGAEPSLCRFWNHFARRSGVRCCRLGPTARGVQGRDSRDSRGGSTRCLAPSVPTSHTFAPAAFLDQFEPIIQEYHALLTTNSIFIKRTAAIGLLSPEMALDYGCTGPVLRGSGVDYDLRRDGEERYTEMYDGYAFEVICERNGHYPKDHDYPLVPKEAILGDCWHRFYVRMLEVVQAVDLVRQAIDRYSTAKGNWGEPIKLTAKLPKGEAYMETECPRGQMGFYIVSDGSSIPWRVRARSSSFCNLSVTHELCRGCLIADVPAIVGSLDVVMGEIDR
jgi:NADH-quinone oxidoreductase subunit D